MVVLHMAMVLRRLREAPEAAKPLAQGGFDAFCRDMDGNLREMGVGDLAVPKEMRRFGEAFYGRAAAYDRALADANDAELAATLARNVFGREAHPAAGRLAAYVRATEGALARDLSWAEDGAPRFPDPAEIRAA
jgi:cytochrome b pre-mRNA-processing protein 3